jgi:hypothetical protein
VRSPELPAVPSKPLTREQADRVVSRLPKVDLDTLVNRPSDKAVQLGRSIQLDMSEREKEALHYWGEEGYKRIGRVEVGKINPDRDSPEKVAEARSHIDHLYRAIGEAELKAEERGDEPIQLYRGISFNSADTYSRFVVENEVDFDRLSSWSSDPKIAEEFTVLGRAQGDLLAAHHWRPADRVVRARAG